MTNQKTPSEVLLELPEAAKQLADIFNRMGMNMKWRGMPQTEIKYVGGVPHLLCTLKIRIPIGQSQTTSGITPGDTNPSILPLSSPAETDATNCKNVSITDSGDNSDLSQPA